MSNQDAAPPAEMDVESARVFRFPREEVFGAFADPAALAGWWGPRGFANRFEQFDLRPGGVWRFTMTGPDGTSYPMDKRFVEVVPFERIVIDHIDPQHAFRMWILLVPVPQGTRMTWQIRFESPEEAARVRDAFAQGNEDNFDRLEEFLDPRAGV